MMKNHRLMMKNRRRKEVYFQAPSCSSLTSNGLKDLFEEVNGVVRQGMLLEW